MLGSLRSLAPALTATAVAAGVLVTGAGASAQQLRFSKTTTGGVVATGNTLGLAKQLNANGPGTEDSIGTFISLNAASADLLPLAAPPWPGGTTALWTENGSTGTLALPAGASVLYAELVWGGGYEYVDDVSAFLDTPVTLATGASSTLVTPSATTALTISETAVSAFLARYYSRSADVTAFVATHGGGLYSVSGVPATQNEGINSLNAAGWTLVVAYGAEGSPARNLSVFVGGSFVDEDSQQDYSVSGFCTPPFGPVGGRVVVSALEGDADLAGDELSIGATTAGPFAPLSGPNNPATNFFASQINGPNGALDASGSFGGVNHDAALGVTVVGGRQGWDVTTVPVSAAGGHLQNDQTSAVLRTNTTGDSFVPVLLAFEIDVNSPDFTISTLVSNDASVAIDDVFTVTATLANGGEEPAALSFFMPLDPGLELVGYTTNGVAGDANGQPVLASQLASGVAAGTLAPAQTRQIVLTLKVLGAPAGGVTFGFAASFAYSYVSCAGEAPVDDDWGMPGLNVTFEPPQPDAGAGGQAGAGGSAGAAGSSGASSGGASSGGSSSGGSSSGGSSSGGTSGGEGGDAGSAAAGSAGTAATGAGGSGQGGEGGAAGAAAAGAGGAAAQDAGTDGTAGTAGYDPGPIADENALCVCSAPGAPRSAAPSWLGVALGVAGLLARRRRAL